MNKIEKLKAELSEIKQIIYSLCEDKLNHWGELNWRKSITSYSRTRKNVWTWKYRKTQKHIYFWPTKQEKHGWTLIV